MNVIVMDGEREECMDPGKNGAILDAGGSGGPGPPGGEGTGSWHHTVEEVRHSQDVGRHRRRAQRNIKPHLCTEYLRGVFTSNPDDLNKRKTIIVRAISIFSFHLHYRCGS
jgi:hypothetical protein